MSYQHWMEAEEALERDGATYLAPTGLEKQSPYVQIARGFMSDMRSLMQEFGMTPSARSRLSISPPDRTDDAEEFLFGPRGS